MSAIPAGLSIAVAAAEGLVGPVFIRQRLIGIFVPDATVEERHVDELAITDQPVEQGSVISDHSYKMPSRLTMTVGWTNSTPAGNQNRVEEIYAALLALQATRLPFIVLTGKRSYTNMLFSSLLVTTNVKSENSLMLVAEMKQITIVTTQVLTVPSADVQKTPQLNAAVANTGTKSLLPGNAFNSAAAPKPLEITISAPEATGG